MRALLACALVALAAAPAVAQPSDAIGKPLPDPSLKDGTVAVRLIAGDRGKPVAGAEVTLTILPASGMGTPLEKRARTDAEGRASFSEVPEGMLVKASAQGEDEVVSSSQFPMPQTGGVRLLVSTMKMAEAMGGPPPGGPPMSPRAMSGQPRPEQADEGDLLTVRVSYDDFADPSPPKDQPVVLVDYRFDHKVSARIVRTDAGGRAVFNKLSRGGSHSYFAMTLLPRGNGFDRLTSVPVVPPGEVGVRVMLSGEKRTATTPVDDLSLVSPQPKAGVPAGTVDVTLVGVIDGPMKVELVDAFSGEVLATTPGGAPEADPDSIQAKWSTGTTALPAGVLKLNTSRTSRPVTGTLVEIRRAGVAATVAPAWTTVTGTGGTTQLTGLPVGQPLDVYVTIEGIALPVRQVTLPAKAGLEESVDVQWQLRGQGRARFTGITAGGPERAFFVRTVVKSSSYLSAPFQLPSDRGAAIELLVAPRVLLQFSLTSWIDDVYLGVRGTFAIHNTSLAPYVAGTSERPEELIIPLPAGFKGATVREDFAELVGVDATRGLVIRRPLPPGGLQFVAGFSLETQNGTLTWDLPLPLGVFQGGMEIQKRGRMTLEAPAGASVREVADQRGNPFFVLSPIQILPGKSMTFTIHGLPQPPVWRRYASLFAGAVVLLILAAGVAFALSGPRRKAPARTRFDELLDELAALEAKGEPSPRRDQLMAELEKLYASGAKPSPRATAE